jgi:hypothetical protein
MATYGGLVDLIISQLGRSDTSLTSFVQMEVISAVDFYSTTRFWFNEGRATFTTSSGQATYTGTTDIMEIDSMVITLSGQKLPLDPMNYAVLNEMDSGTVTGQPTKWSWWQESIRLYPTPKCFDDPGD